MAFKDPDGSKKKELLTTKQLYLFGTCAKIKKWKQAPPKAQPQLPAAVMQGSEQLLVANPAANKEDLMAPKDPNSQPKHSSSL
ncbi:hypothetical protein BJV74DRAFT_891743 [Russula compacta]|nr:hypothetical protein BJV74DRAFT_891743 [Russula compacta]